MVPLLAEIDAVWLFVVGCAMLSFILLKHSYRYFGRRRRNSNSAPIELQHRPDSAWDGAKHDTMAWIDRQEVEMQEMARDINGQLSSKIIILEKLIADSQQQIHRMEHLLNEMKHSDSLPK